MGWFQEATENVANTVTGKKKQGTRPKTNVPGVSNPGTANIGGFGGGWGGNAAIGSSGGGGNVPTPDFGGPTMEMPDWWDPIDKAWKQGVTGTYDNTFSGENVASSVGHSTGMGPSRSVPGGPANPYAGMNPNMRALSEHLGQTPDWGSIYGDGGYSPDHFGYDRDSYEFDETNYYDPTKLGSEGYELASLEEMNFDPYRRNALQDVTATSASGQASAEGAMARSGGLSASDRMAMASQFNRDKIAGRSGALGKYDEFEAQNVYDVGQANVGIDNEAASWNAQQQTIRDKDAAQMAHDTQIAEVEAANLHRKNEQARRYQEQMDQYNADLEAWYLEGQFMAGGAVKADKPTPPPPPGPANVGGYDYNDPGPARNPADVSMDRGRTPGGNRGSLGR